ncbi:TetR/AcrR family transcriptional regulator [Nitrincola sp.]|uniref:TetR/AcrR family transcriptional regulator n=1 Tax=Nitrincola sp. TaxID=1926584 RepID=UPI003A9057EE
MNMPETGWRGSPEIWIDIAYDTLITRGVETVRIQPLSKQLGLSRTSFYWFFKDREALLEALIQRWRDKNTGNLIQQTQAYAENITEAVLNLFDCWLDQELFDDAFEFAMRNWALQSAEVEAEIEQADQRRLQAIREMFEQFGFASQEADIRARTIYLTQIGYVSMRTHESLAVRMARIKDYVWVFTGQAASPNQLKRFYHRHSFSPD